jgi:hypothetical protein
MLRFAQHDRSCVRIETRQLPPRGSFPKRHPAEAKAAPCCWAYRPELSRALVTKQCRSMQNPDFLLGTLRHCSTSLSRKSREKTIADPSTPAASRPSLKDDTAWIFIHFPRPKVQSHPERARGHAALQMTPGIERRGICLSRWDGEFPLRTRWQSRIPF